MAYHVLGLFHRAVDWAMFEQLHHVDFIDHSPAGRGHDRAAFGVGLRTFVTAFPDLHTSVEDVVTDDERDRVAVRWRAIGTNRGLFLGRAPTGLRTAITGIEIIRVECDQVIERWGEWDITAQEIDTPA